MRFFGSSPPAPAPRPLPPVGNVVNFLACLAQTAPPIGQATHSFPKPDGGFHGYVQFIIDSDRELMIHRFWSCHPDNGSGSVMLRTLCNLADQHGIQMN